MAYGLISDIKSVYIHVGMSYNSPNKKVMPVIPFSPVLPPPGKLISHLTVPGLTELVLPN
jgi:hypothetical protein